MGAKRSAVEVDPDEAKRARKAAKKAALLAAAAEEEAPTEEVDEAEAKRLRKAAKKAAKAATAAAEEEAVVEADVELDEEQAKKQRKAAKKAAKAAAAAAAAAETEAPTTPKQDQKKKRAEAAGDENAEDAPKSKKSKIAADGADDANKTATAAGDDKGFYKVFIRGLPFSVTEAKLREDFTECGEIIEFKMPMNDEGKPKGFVFILYATKAGFDAALKYDQTDYGGRTINVAQANDPRGGPAGKASAKGQSKGKDGKDGDWNCPKCDDLVFAKNSQCRKCGADRPGGGGGANPPEFTHENTVFIRGLPWAVTVELLTKDFGECGEIENVKMPLNEEQRPRGIAFIKFKTVEGVDAALKFENTDYGGRTINVCKSGEGKGGKANAGKDGKDGKGKDGKGKGKGKDGKGKSKGKGKAPTEERAKHTGCIVAPTAEVKKFADSDSEN